MSLTKRLTALGIVGLLLYQVFWHCLMAPPETAPAWLVTLLFALPLIPVCVLAFIKHRTFAFWGGTLALFYFSHGVMEAWTLRDIWPLGFGEAVISVWVIIAASWDGMKKRFAKKAIEKPIEKAD
ncbi:MAG: DUF2069 domain-containing protein [Arenimonas sp.]